MDTTNWIAHHALVKLRQSLWRATVLACVYVLIVMSSAFAYTRSDAAAYADDWWNDYNPFFIRYNDDCANFVSQSVFSGGYPMNFSTNNPWWYQYDPASNSLSWSIVSYNRGFFLNDTNPGGYIVNSFYGVKTHSISGVRGDIVYYDFRGDRYFDTDPHESLIAVTNGWATSTNDYGALVDAHTNARHHEYWTLWYFNSRWPYTYIEVLHFRT